MPVWTIVYFVDFVTAYVSKKVMLYVGGNPVNSVIMDLLFVNNTTLKFLNNLY